MMSPNDRLPRLLAFLTRCGPAWWAAVLDTPTTLGVTPTGTLLLPGLPPNDEPVRLRHETADELLEALVAADFLPMEFLNREDWRYGCFECASQEYRLPCCIASTPHPPYTPKFRSLAEGLAFASLDPGRVRQATEHVALVLRTHLGPTTPRIFWLPCPFDAMPQYDPHRLIYQTSERSVRINGVVLPSGMAAYHDEALASLWRNGFPVQSLSRDGAIVRYYVPFRAVSV